MEVVALGCRNLAPYGWQPIKNPYLELDCGLAGKANCVARTSKSKTPSGSDPNFITVVRVPVQIPINPLFMPMLNLKVIDTRMGGLLKPIVGSCSIDLTSKVKGSIHYRPPCSDRIETRNPFFETPDRYTSAVYTHYTS